MPLVRIDVRYYDKKQRKQFDRRPIGDRVRQIVDAGIEVDELDLIAHTIFSEQKDSDGWRTYKDLRQRLPDRIGHFRDYFDLSQGTVRSKFGPSQTDKSQIEKIGVATSILVTNGIFGFTEADWTRIRETPKSKTLDFRLASDGAKYIALDARAIDLESKGTISDDTRLKSPSISRQKKDILQKKQEQRSINNENVLVGAIAAIPTRPEQRAVCWLIDPPGIGPDDIPPRKYKLLARLTFYLRGLRLISTPPLLVALGDRIEAIRAIRDYDQLDEIGLYGANGRQLSVTGALFRGKTVIDGQVIGRMVPVGRKEFFFYGFELNIYRMLARQRFDEILRFESSLHKGIAVPHRITALIEAIDLEEIPIEEPDAQTIEKGKQFEIPMTGSMLVTKSGRALGFFIPELDAQKR